MERTNEVMLIVLAKKNPDMYSLAFNNKTEMLNWITAIKNARSIAPKYGNFDYKSYFLFLVLMAKGPLLIESSSSRTGEEPVDPEESAFNLKIQKWQKDLDFLFGKIFKVFYKKTLVDRMKLERNFESYFIECMKFFDLLQKHLKKFPTRNNNNNEHSGLPSTSIKGVKENNRDVEKVFYFFIKKIF